MQKPMRNHWSLQVFHYFPIWASALFWSSIHLKIYSFLVRIFSEKSMKIRSEINMFCDVNSGPIFALILLHFGRVLGRVWPPLGSILDVLGPWTASWVPLGASWRVLSLLWTTKWQISSIFYWFSSIFHCFWTPISSNFEYFSIVFFIHLDIQLIIFCQGPAVRAQRLNNKQKGYKISELVAFFLIIF